MRSSLFPALCSFTTNEKLTAQHIRESLLQEIEASQQAICELKSEELEEVIGAVTPSFLKLNTLFLHRVMERDIDSDELATSIQKGIRDNAEAKKPLKSARGGQRF